MSMALNTDRATLNFLNAFPEEIRLRGEKLQKDGAVTQIFGNHLYIQGRVEDAYGVHRVNLRLQGNRWFGACSTEDEDLAGAAMYAAMLERIQKKGIPYVIVCNKIDEAPARIFRSPRTN